MKRLKLYITQGSGMLVLLCSMMAISSCTKKYEEINTNRNSVATVGSGELPFLFAKAESSTIPNIWNYQVAQNLFADQYAFIKNSTTKGGSREIRF